MAMLISFIVPVFNTKATLGNCVESLMNQGLPEGTYEIILVNDGSADGSEQLCLEYAGEYDCIRVLSQENRGLSEARNSGIRAAGGEYLCFVDSDDRLIPGGIAPLSVYCNGENDLVRFWSQLVCPGTGAPVDEGDGRILFAGTGREYLRQYGLETFCTIYLYRKDFVLEKGLFFPSRLIGEDFSYMFDVMMTNPRIVSAARRVYQYFIHPESISTSRSPEHSRRWVRDLSGTMARIARELEPFRDSDPALYASCHRGLDQKMPSLFSRILSARYTKEEYRRLLSSCEMAGLLPLQTQSQPLISTLTSFPSLYPLASVLFRRVFLPYIYPRIDRNGK